MNKLEKHIRQKFRERELPPSPKAWQRINDTMGEEKRPQNRRPLFWTVGIAAGFLVTITLSIGYWSSKDTHEIKHEMVEGTTQEEVKEEGITPTPNITQEEFNTPIRSKGNTAVVVDAEQLELNSDTSFSNTLHNRSSIVENQKQAISPLEPEVKRIENVVDAKIEDKLNEVLAQVIAMEDSKITVTDAEIDSLLLAAQQELLMEKVIQENGKVDAIALLNEVEEELDQSFRDQLFDTLKEGFFKLRTAVADRNN